MSLDEIPEEVRQNLPPELAKAQLVGGEIADASESARLYGPPGTGKSTQSAFRIATLAEETGLPASQVTVVTYRSALAGVVRQRLMDWDVYEARENVSPASPAEENPFRFWSTIHAAAARATGFMERIDDDEDGLAGMVTPRAEREFCSEIGINHLPAKPWQETRWTTFYDLYTYAKSNLLDIGQNDHIAGDGTPLRADHGAERRLEDFREEWGARASIEEIAKRWERFKRENDVHDFYELLVAALDGGLPPTRLVVIDEYHDVTPLMAAVAERWIDAAQTAIVAGDPDQVVNAYAGATPRFFEELDSRVGTDLPVIQLSRSWRCPDEHYAAASRVLRTQREPPALTTNGAGEILRHHAPSLDHDDEEWRLPDRELENNPVDLWRRFGPDVMFLSRTQKQADGVAAALDAAGIVYVSQEGVEGDWEERLTLLRGLDLLEDVRPETAVESNRLSEFDTDASEPKSPENRALSQAEARTLIRHTNGHYLDSDREKVLEELRATKSDQDIPLTALVEHVTDKWWLRYGSGKTSIGELTRLSNRDREAMQNAWNRYDDRFEMALASGTRVLTIHASKGAEASDVVVFDGITGRIQDALEQRQAARENEARTWYVALTRASQRLHVIRDAFEWTDPYLPPDLEPHAADEARRRGVADD